MYLFIYVFISAGHIFERVPPLEDPLRTYSPARARQSSKAYIRVEARGLHYPPCRSLLVILTGALQKPRT